MFKSPNNCKSLEVSNSIFGLSSSQHTTCICNDMLAFTFFSLHENSTMPKAEASVHKVKGSE